MRLIKEVDARFDFLAKGIAARIQILRTLKHSMIAAAFLFVILEWGGATGFVNQLETTPADTLGLLVVSVPELRFAGVSIVLVGLLQSLVTCLLTLRVSRWQRFVSLTHGLIESNTVDGAEGLGEHG